MVIRKLVDAGIKASRMDKRAWDKLYFGIRKDIKLGIKHGFGAGSILGNFIEDGSTPFDENGIPEKPRYGPKTYQQRQKYYRRRVSRCRCRKRNYRSTRYRS